MEHSPAPTASTVALPPNTPPPPLSCARLRSLWRAAQRTRVHAALLTSWPPRSPLLPARVCNTRSEEGVNTAPRRQKARGKEGREEFWRVQRRGSDGCASRGESAAFCGAAEPA